MKGKKQTMQKKTRKKQAQIKKSGKCSTFEIEIDCRAQILTRSPEYQLGTLVLRDQTRWFKQAEKEGIIYTYKCVYVYIY